MKPGLNLTFLACLILFAAPASAATLYALVDTGELYASADGGASWSAQSALPVSDAAGLLAGTSSSELFLASRSGTVYRSIDAGMSWSAVGAVAASDVVDLSVTVGGTLLVLTESGTVWASADDGVTFSALSAMTAPDLASLVRGDAGRLLAVTRTGTIRRSTDNGGSWSAVGAIPVSDAVSVRALGLAYFVLTDPGVVYRSLDNGASWTAVGTVSQVGMRGLVEDDGELVAVQQAGLAARSTDGTSWSWVGTVNQVNVVAVASDEPQVIGVPEGPGGRVGMTLAPPYPNPLRAGSTVELAFSLPEAGTVRLGLFDLNGRLVRERSAESRAAGEATIRWDLPGLASGVYFLRLTHKAGERSVRMVVLE